MCTLRKNADLKWTIIKELQRNFQPTVNRRKDKPKVRAEINETANKKIIEKIDETNNYF